MKAGWEDRFFISCCGNFYGEEEIMKICRAAGLIVDEKPDIASFRKKAYMIQGLEIFRAKEVRQLLREFQKAAAGAGRK